MPDDRLYIKVHHGMPEHPKVVGLSDRAFRALVTLWCYCDRNNTDGIVPGVIALKETKRAVVELEKAGLLKSAAGDWDMHDYLGHQRSKDQKDELKIKRREAGSLGGKAKANNLASAIASAKQKVKQTPSKNVADLEKEKELTTLAAKPRDRDPIWDAVVEACGINDAELTKSGKGPVVAAVRDLKAVNATPAQVKLRARNYRARFAGAELTATALAKHWASLEGSAVAAPAQAVSKGW